MDTVNKEWNIKVVFITFYKFSVTVKNIVTGFKLSGYLKSVMKKAKKYEAE